MINVAIAGCGSITRKRHAPEYKNNPGARIIGFYDYLPARAEELQAEYGGKVYTDFSDLLADKTVQAVSICTANKFHASMTIEALQAGKHVLCEKPMASSVKEAEAMCDAELKSGKHIMLGHNQRLTGAHLKARELLAAGKIGRVLTFKTCFGHSGPENWGIDKGKSTWFFDQKQAFVGSLGDLGVHKIDLLRYLLQDEIIQVSSLVATLDKKDSKGDPIGVDDNMVSLIKMKCGSLGTLTCSWTYYGEEDNSTLLYGVKGIMKIYHTPQKPLIVINPDGSQEEYSVGAISTNDQQLNSGIIDAFIESLNQQEKPPISSQDGLETLRVVEALLLSTEKGEVVNI